MLYLLLFFPVTFFKILQIHFDSLPAPTLFFKFYLLQIIRKIKIVKIYHFNLKIVKMLLYTIL